MPRQTTIYAKSVTATADTPFQVEPEGSIEGSTLLSDVNIHCSTNDAYYGNSAYQLGIIRTNAVVWFTGTVKVSDLWFKNLTGGSNCVITLVGVIKKGGS